MTLWQYCLIGIGGALGAAARYAVGTWVMSKVSSGFPWGTFVINISGSFIIGLMMTLFSERLLPKTYLQPLVAIGFVGAYTTFSTFEYETARLSSSWQAMGNLLGSVAAGYAAVWAGIRIAMLLSGARG